ncbi:HvfX family Cu-binding RiPP maturation protein [Lacimicrobium alkaliphilum]|uniref:DoxD-like inner membrane protein n=1 Tax=Lacimicrobium alkaliphilum TaxID=1526571 RepID=A0ABQ1RHF6_9ALTE|nr:DoxX family protein [Lacimicrobium alkaliphilum]GGD66614.1 DoxD-like inner membrane protein [Lacimicrobium alkaliphilum]
MLSALAKLYLRTLDKLQQFNGIPSLLIRLYLAPVMIQAGWNKYSSFADTAAWFGNPDWGLGLPFPALMASLAIAAELFGGILLLLGLMTRLVTIPLMVTMLVATFSVHWSNGWPAIADTSSWLADGTLLLNESVMASAEKLDAANSILKEYGNYEWLNASGKFVVLNNGIEFAVTYFVMLLALMFMGGGRYLSVDFWLKRTLCNQLNTRGQ